MRTETFDALASLLAYPRSDFRETLDAAIAAAGVVRASRPPLGSEGPERGAGETPAPHGDDAAFTGPVETTLIRFREAVEGLPAHELEEAFTTTFDLDPVAALEVGWHLFGDTYERGRFLVEMRQRLHRLGMGESGELPDHLATVLRVLPRLDRADAEALARGAVIPALQKMLEPLRSRESTLPSAPPVRRRASRRGRDRLRRSVPQFGA